MGKNTWDVPEEADRVPSAAGWAALEEDEYTDEQLNRGALATLLTNPKLSKKVRQRVIENPDTAGVFMVGANLGLPLGLMLLASGDMDKVRGSLAPEDVLNE